MTGAIAGDIIGSVYEWRNGASYYKSIQLFIVEKVRAILPPEFLKIVDDFNDAFGVAF